MNEAEREPSTLERARALLGHPDALEHVLVLAAATTWLLYLTPASGGFHDPSTAVTAAAFLPALLAVRPWRTVSPVILTLVLLAGLGAVTALLLTPTGWQQADSPAGQLLGLLALVVCAGFARTAARRWAVVVVLLTAVMLQFIPAWKAWKGSGDPNHLMVGTFYWHNQLGIWMAALGLVATAWTVGGHGWSRWAAGVVAPFAVASVVLSTARTDLGLLVGGLVALVPLVLRSERRLASALRWAAVPASAALLLVVLTSSLFFARPWSGPAVLQKNASVTSAAGDRGGDSLATHGGDRARWTSAALGSFSEHPVLGDGFGSFRFTVGSRVPLGANTSAFVHDGYAEALASGGLAFGLPILALCLLIGVIAVRRYVLSLRAECTERPLLAGASLAAGALLVHAGLDFDWHYPSLVVLLGVVGGLLVSAETAPTRSSPRGVVAAGAVLVTLIVAAASLVEHHGRQLTTDGRTHTAVQLLDARWPGTDDPRIDRAALVACLNPDGTLATTPDVARRALEVSERAARLDPQIRSLRDLVQATLGAR